MSIANVVTRGFGSSAAIKFVVTRGYSVGSGVAVFPTTGDPGGHRRRLLQELDRQQRQDEFERRHESLKAAETEPRSPNEQQRSRTEHSEPSPEPATEPKLKLTATSPLPMIANFGMGPVTIGFKLPSLGESIHNEILADDEDAIDAIIAIILTAQ